MPQEAVLEKPAPQQVVSKAATEVPEKSVPIVEDVPDVAQIEPAQEESYTGIDHLASGLLNPSTRRIHFQIGHLDGRPERYDGPLAEHEYGSLFRIEHVLHLKGSNVYKQFPQQVAQDQRIVMHLPELPNENLLFRALAVRTGALQEPFNPTLPEPALEVLCNGKMIWKRNLSRQPFWVNALIPAGYLEGYENTITLINCGSLPLVFDALWVESAVDACESVDFQIKDLAHVPPALQGWFRAFDANGIAKPIQLADNRDSILQFPALRLTRALSEGSPYDWSCCGVWRYSNPFVDFQSQEKVVRMFLEEMIGWYFLGGNSLVIENMTGTGLFFCPRTGRPYASAYALWTSACLFQGKPKRLFMNVLPVEDNSAPLGLVYWMATENKPDVATIMVVGSRYDILPDKIRVVCALPWSGATTAKISIGVFPENLKMKKPTHRGVFRDGERVDDPEAEYDRNRVDMPRNVILKPNGTGGLLDAAFEIRDSLYIRLLKGGAEDIRSTSTSKQETTVVMKWLADRCAVNVVKSRENKFASLGVLSLFSQVMVPLSGNYHVHIDAATSATIGTQEHVVPFDSESLFLDIDFPDEKPRTAEGAALSLYSFHQQLENKKLSFWVFPHVQSKKKQVPLGISLGNWKSSVFLESGKWQRVEFCLPDLSDTSDRYLIFHSPHEYDAYGDKKGVTFELNGITLIDDGKNFAHYAATRSISGKEPNMAIILLGEPGKETCFRHYFPSAVKVAGIAPITDVQTEGKLDCKYRNASQMLEINRIRFPESIDKPAWEYLNYTEKQICKQKCLVPVVIVADIQT